MNLFLTNLCNESCSFCYAERWFKGSPKVDRRQIDALMGHLEAYARLVHAAPPLPPFDALLDEPTRTLFSSRVVNLLGGEPTVHPYFTDIVEKVHALGLGAIVFTNASMPKRIQAVADKLWSVTVNGHFAARAPKLGFDMARVHANLPIRPGHDVVKELTAVRDAGIRTVYLAFATPAGDTPGDYYTPLDLAEMKRVHADAVRFCAEHEIFLGYDCSFPVCVDDRVLQTKCSSVPVMDITGHVTICGGEYFHDAGKRHITSFESLAEVHAFTHSLIQGLRALPSRFDLCNGCEHFNERCHGMCLAFRVEPEDPSVPLTRAAG